MNQYTIRRNVLNMTMNQWDKFGKRKTWTGTVSQWFKLYGLCGCLSERRNEQEKEFFNSLMLLGHQKKNKQAMESFEKTKTETAIAMEK